MLKDLDLLDRKIFLWVNQDLANPVFDLILPWLRNPYFWTPLYIFLFLYFVKQYRKQSVPIIILFLVALGVSDYFSASIIKPFFERLRPCNNPELQSIMTLRIPRCGVGKSFVSTHACNHFTMAIFLIGVLKPRFSNIGYWTITWAASICLAQVYVGVHYPFDVLVGGILGSIIGYVFVKQIPNLSNFMIKYGYRN